MPPRLVHRFFRWFCHPDLLPTVEGDLLELYDERFRTMSKRKADLRFLFDVLLLFRPGIIRPLEGVHHLNNYGMLKSYFTIGWRNLLKNKGYSLINIGGLALGMAVALLISFWILDEMSFNKYHVNYSQIARVYRYQTSGGETQTSMVHPTGLGTVLKAEYGNHFNRVVLVRQRLEERVLSLGEKKFTQSGYFMQPEGPAMFSLKMVEGSLKGLEDMNSILLSHSLAKKIFGESDALNRVVSMDAQWDLKVTGVYEDLPKNSEFNEATYFAPLDRYLSGIGSNLTSWNNYNMNLYVEYSAGSDVGELSSLIKNALGSHSEEARVSKPELFLVPMSQWRLFSQFKNGIPVTSDRIKVVWIFGLIGGFVLLLACINFMNLSTARSEKRAKEVGIRKSIGSHRRQLICQFFSESLLVAMLSFVVALLLVVLVLPAFNAIADKQTVLPWSHPLFWAGGLSFVLITGLLAGSYPALYLSSFNPVNVLKGTFRAGRLASLPRKLLVVIQFTVSITLIIGTITVYQQVQFAKNRPMGYSRQGLIALHSRSPELKGKYEVLRNEFKKTGVVEEMGEADHSVNSTLGWNGGFDWKGKEASMEDPTFNINWVTHEYGKTIGWNFMEGRDFAREIPSDLSGVVINESARKVLGLEHPVGELLIRNDGDRRAAFTIVGVITDMVKGSPFEPTDPCLFFLAEGDLEWIYLRMNPASTAHGAIPLMEKAFARVITSAPFDYKFADDEYDAKFRAEERVGSLAALLTFLAILISCSGLFGLASYVAEQRTKEIGIRKVLGASASQIWQLLSSEFMVLVTVACVLSVPFAYYGATRWLEQYEYRTSVSWYVFALAGSGALLITLLTVSIQAVKTAIANPVRSLRSE